MTAVAVRSVVPDAQALVLLFDTLFAVSEQTCLRGGADEPLYTPPAPGRSAIVAFRADYVASALHEVAHWCIAGPARRRRVDYGYWYQPDGRDADAQRRFMAVEARPQALEWLFSLACGLSFRPSFDNIDAPPPEAVQAAFSAAIVREARRLRERGLPRRAACFRDALAAHYRPGQSLAGLDLRAPGRG
jgi:elongation factor P hydroxylase